jgi:Skp family chaperone for outer membrane proteins
MSQSPTWWRVLVLSTMVVCLAFALRASGASEKQITFATVDIQKINDNYKLKAVLETQFQQLQAKWQGRLARRQNMPLLTEDEQKQIDAIEEKGPNQTDADKATLKQLMDKAQQLNNQLVALRQKKESELTDADKAQLATLEAQIAKASDQYNTMQDQMKADLTNFDNQNSELLVKNIRDAVAQVAKEKGITIVFNNQVVLYSGVDITDQVLAILNK